MDKFAPLAELWGDCTGLDQHTENKSVLKSASILIDTSHLASIDEEVPNIEGKAFRLRVNENKPEVQENHLQFLTPFDARGP